MISLISEPERIKMGETCKVKLDIQGTINLKMYKGAYFNLVLKKNGGTLGSTTLYPLRFNGFPLEWEINPNSYEFDGTFNVNCVLQSGYSSILSGYSSIVSSSLNSISNTTFIVEPICLVKGANICNNLTVIEQMKRTKDSEIKKQEIPIDWTGGCQIQKPGTTTIIEKEVIKEVPNSIDENFRSIMISSARVQKSSRNVGGI